MKQIRKMKIWMLFAAFTMFFVSTAHANVTLPYILSENMVLQRDIPVNIWGWANSGEKVTVSINGQKFSARADQNGAWKVKLKPMAAGGPFELVVKGKNTIILKNIMVGDVWVCGGQSNMEFPLIRSRNWETDKNTADRPNIRLFSVPRKMSLKPLDNTQKASWEVCNENTASGFSAIGYYFGKNLSEKLNIPIGLINSNWGGTDIETWMSLEKLYEDEDFRVKIDKMRTSNLEQLQKEGDENLKKWQDAVTLKDPGMINKWYADADVTGWNTMKLPQIWEGAGHPDMDGVVWFKKDFQVSAADAGKEITIAIGPVDDSDDTYVNGKLIGKTEGRYDLPRVYKVPAGVTREGTNTIAVKVTDNGGGGGIWGTDKQMYTELNGVKTSLAGDWRYKVAVDLPVPQATSGPNSYPSFLYNGMIHPIINYPIKGVIWYQGENNAGNYIKYRNLFPSMIKDWRAKWNIGDFAFLFVQLANFMEVSSTPQESSWAGLREAQTMTLSVPETGMAVIIDIGDAADIHPRNKDDVGYRLYLSALKVAHDQNIVYSGPLYKSMKVEGNRIVLEFDQIGSGLMAKDKYGYLKAFAIAGADRKFVWAKAVITADNKVLVYSDAVQNPVAVRYAWANNPDDANLYNMEGLPASPFRTDQW